MHFFQFQNIKKYNLEFNLCIFECGFYFIKSSHTQLKKILSLLNCYYVCWQQLSTVLFEFFCPSTVADEHKEISSSLLAPHMWEYKHPPVCSVKWWTNRFIWVYFGFLLRGFGGMLQCKYPIQWNVLKLWYIQSKYDIFRTKCYTKHMM